MSISVGDKFIIEVGAIAELPDGKKKYFIKPFESLVFDRKGLNQLEKFDTQALKEYDLGYKTGYDLAVENAQETKLAWGEQEYNRGLEDVDHAIEVVKAMTGEECAEWFEDCVGLDAVICGFTIPRIIEIAKAYEEKKKAEIKVGDVVTHEKGGIMIVTRVNKITQTISGVCADGEYFDSDMAKWHKTGKHYDIESILKELGE